MKHILTAVCFSAMLCPAQTGIQAPRLGVVADADGSLRPLLGFAGNLFLGDAIGVDVITSASSGSISMVKTITALTVLDQSAQLLFAMDLDDPGPALFAFRPDGSPARVYLPRSGALFAWKTDHFEPDSTAVPSGIFAIGDRAFLVQRGEAIWRVDDAGETLLPGLAGPTLLLADGAVVYTDDTSVVIRDANGVERRIDTGVQIGEFRQLGAGWIEAIEPGPGRLFAICILPGREQSSQLPEGR